MPARRKPTSVVHKVEFRPAAVTDLRRIYLRIAPEAGHERAGNYIDRIEAACMSLAAFPTAELSGAISSPAYVS
ncbi:type II toxin-antitoxin system RelE/ParE family toxin [Neorhizobium tomejilense]|uniref:type II toxin-antitoxin system RelE/ParE family toxin n=1 Tax=Neorhizobium tomejilense TaxID=2093828 RepID=UPI003ECCAB05